MRSKNIINKVSETSKIGVAGIFAGAFCVVFAVIYTLVCFFKVKNRE